MFAGEVMAFLVVGIGDCMVGSFEVGVHYQPVGIFLYLEALEFGVQHPGAMLTPYQYLCYYYILTVINTCRCVKSSTTAQ